MRFAVKRGELKGRLDATFHSPLLRSVDVVVERAKNPVLRLGELCLEIGGGATPIRKDDSQYAQEGIKFLRIQNVTEQGLDFSDVKFITTTTHESLLNRSQLREGDVLMTITGRIGTASVVRQEDLPANINQHIVFLRLKRELVIPDYLALFLNSDLGLKLSNRSVSGTTRLALDYTAVRNIPIPLPSLEVQQSLVSRMENTRKARNELLKRADELLTQLDTYVLETLGLSSPC